MKDRHTMSVQEYIKAVDEQYQTGLAREHSYRPALQQLLSEMLPDHIVTNEPAHFDCGAPDYIISQKKGAKQPVFFIEAKDLFDNDLDGVRQHKEQFNRYKSSLEYIIFTDYLDFHIYEHGEWTKNIRIGEQQGTHIRLVKGSEEEFTAAINHLADSQPTPIASPARLAQLMASKARLLADVIRNAFQNANDDESGTYHENSQLEAQLKAFRNILIHDLEPEGFADIYAQTIAYGMFAARLHDDTPENFSRLEAATLIPKTNPFLRQIFQQIAGYDLDERIAWIVDDLARTFLVTDVEKVMKTYGGNALHSDPMIHFYEDFLSAYDPKLRKAKGVWYTPQPVVHFIVSAVDEILQRDFHLPMGLADDSMIEHEVLNDEWNGKKESDKTIKRKEHRVQILDPATGTGTFLAEVVRQIYGKFQGMQGMWQGYVDEHLLPRLYGFELLMASYAVAHLKLDMQLRSLGYDSAKNNNRRLGIYLTNSLEECNADTGNIWSQWLSSEANQANFIKRDCPVMVMVGNPPYSVSSSNKGEWIKGLIDEYKHDLNERNIQPLSDDYIKFIRLGQHYVERNGQGILAYISNNSFIDGIIHREMRHQLLLAFDDIYILNLHGNSRKKETAPDGSADENVFDIMQGVSINIFVRKPEHKKGILGRVFYKDIYGSRESKYEYLESHQLAGNIDWQELQILEPNYFFVPKDYGENDGYDKMLSVPMLFKIGSMGIASGDDQHLVSMDKDSIYYQYRLNDNFAYHPFDNRFTFFDNTVLQRARWKLMSNYVGKNNIGINIVRQSKLKGVEILATTCISNRDLITNHTYNYPLYLYTTDIDGTETKIPNLNAEEWKKFSDAAGREVMPEELLDYIYGVLHSPSYRERYKEFLKIDFPRIPLPPSGDEFDRIAGYGRKLINLHLMRDAASWQLEAQYNVPGTNTVEEVRYDDGKVWINSEQYFGNVPAEAWNAYIGGYQPAQKWLRDRKGRTLGYDDIRHYLRIIHALLGTASIMTDIG